MAKFKITGYCFAHAGELNEEATSLKSANAKAEEMKRVILRKLAVPKDGSAIVSIYGDVGHGYMEIVRERVEWP